MQYYHVEAGLAPKQPRAPSVWRMIQKNKYVFALFQCISELLLL
jgi:hypothetical protein